MGYAPDEESLVMPWTRQQCLILVEEAEDLAARRSMILSDPGMNVQALRLIDALKVEFEGDLESGANARIESLYANYTQISGLPLRDSYHFGQTIADNYGRPYAQGANTINGISAYGTAGRFSGYIRAEYQGASATSAYSENVRQFIGAVDQIPTPPDTGSPSTSRFNPLEMYIGAGLGLFNVTVGKQSLWWGPGEASAFQFSDNAEPLYGVQANQDRPILLPGPFRFLGRIRTYFLLGRLSGHQFPPGPWINAQKITLQLTQNLELGFMRSAIFAGTGHPLTVGSFFRSIFSVSSTGGTAFGSANDPGDRRSGFDFRWHVPKLRRYVTIYSDSLADDDPNPLANPRRSAWGPGIYITKLPHLQNLDLQFETYATWVYRKDEGGIFIYWNNQYHDAYTNDGFILGSWVGRDARAYTASSTYWVSAQNKITASFRQIKTGGNFLPGGGTQTDISLSAQWRVRPELSLAGFIQGERYFLPILGGPQKDIAGGMQLTFYPKNWVVRH